MNDTELKLMHTKVSNMSLTEFENWLDSIKEESYQDGYYDAKENYLNSSGDYDDRFFDD